MVKEIIEEGFENVVAVLKENIEKIKEAENAEIEKATKEIKAKYETRLTRYTDELSHLVMTVEEPDVAEEQGEVAKIELDDTAEKVDVTDSVATNFTEAL